MEFWSLTRWLDVSMVVYFSELDVSVAIYFSELDVSVAI